MIRVLYKLYPSYNKSKKLSNSFSVTTACTPPYKHTSCFSFFLSPYTFVRSLFSGYIIMILGILMYMFFFFKFSSLCNTCFLQPFPSVCLFWSLSFMLEFPQISVVFGYLFTFTWEAPKRLLENAECAGRAVSLGYP